MALLAFNDVHALYGQARILNGVTFDIAAGERVALVGRNGVGKTTVVNTLCGATLGSLFLYDGELFRAAATYGYPENLAQRLRRGVVLSAFLVHGLPCALQASR